MLFQVEIVCDNDAFRDDPNTEVRRILSDLVERLPVRPVIGSTPLYDINGNVVGTASFSIKP